VANFDIGIDIDTFAYYAAGERRKLGKAGICVRLSRTQEQIDDREAWLLLCDQEPVSRFLNPLQALIAKEEGIYQ
jgi:hypothetical protein